MSSLKYKLVVETPANSFIVTSNCPLNVLDKDFLFDLLSANHVFINCSNKTIGFGTPIVGKNERFITANQAEALRDVSVDMNSLPLKKETMFSINLVIGITPISVQHYTMSPLKLVQLKNKIEELLEK
ncbi:hypothetical protein CR513_31194, partial [Mucuna pruriens]